MGHYYTSSGESRYGARIDVARREGLFPSVTEVLNILDKPAIGGWRERLVAEAAYTNSPLSGETLYVYQQRLQAIVKEKKDEAPNRGTQVHELIERYIEGKSVSVSPSLAAIWAPVVPWLEENMTVGEGEVEKTVVYKNLGYAGRVDYLGPMQSDELFEQTWLVDYKTQNVKPRYGRPTFYPDYLYQLGGYYHALQHHDPKVMCVVISNNPECPGVWTKEYTEEEIIFGFAVFLAALKLYRLVKRFPLEDLDG